MALQLDISSTHIGVGFPAAYARIITASVTRQRSGADHKHLVMLDVAIYATPTPDDDTREIDFRRLWLPLEEIQGDIRPGAYAALKRLPEFDGAVDA